jgi:large subunit ribosomal protein L21
MFAVIKTGGKQYKVAENDVISVEKLDTEEGKKVKIKDVLMVGNEGDVTVGDPMIKGAEVTAEVVEQKRNRKIIVFKKKRRQNYRRKNGHRQHQTMLKITGIKA